MLNVEILVLAWGSLYDVRVWGEGNQVLGTFKVDAGDLKAKGILKRSDAFKKAETYLNTEEGFEFMTGMTKTEFLAENNKNLI